MSNNDQMVSVPVSKLKKIHRDLDACQKVIWLRGGFDPAYCKDAQDSLKDIDALLAQHQGEQVARVEVGADRNACVSITDSEWLRGLKDKAAHWVIPLYTHADTGEVERLQAEVKRLKGLQPDSPPRPPDGQGLPRYGLRWNGPQQPLAVPMDDGYWTPWHLAVSADPSAPTSDGFSAGDMADQGAKAFRDGQRAFALPERRQWNGLGNAADNLKASGWNACLDEVRRLNEASISPE